MSPYHDSGQCIQNIRDGNDFRGCLYQAKTSNKQNFSLISKESKMKWDHNSISKAKINEIWRNLICIAKIRRIEINIHSVLFYCPHCRVTNNEKKFNIDELFVMRCMWLTTVACVNVNVWALTWKKWMNKSRRLRLSSHMYKYCLFTRNEHFEFFVWFYFNRYKKHCQVIW